MAAWWLLSSREACADPEPFIAIPSFRSSGLTAAGDGGASAEAGATLAVAAGEDAEEVLAQPADEASSPDFNDAQYAEQFTHGDLENRWYDTAMADLPYTGVHIDWDVPITMSDGKVLKANIYRPVDDEGETVGDKLPVLVNMTPYTKYLSMVLDSVTVPYYSDAFLDYFGNMNLPPGLKGVEQLIQTLNGGFLQEFGVQRRLVQSGYVQVVVDIRGTGFSEGAWGDLDRREQLDGKEVVEWAAGQQWSTGKVGMNGFSTSGINQLATAALHPKGLKAIFPIAPDSDLAVDALAQGGGYNPILEPLLFAGVSWLRSVPNIPDLISGNLDQVWVQDRHDDPYPMWDLTREMLTTPNLDVAAADFVSTLAEDSPARQKLDQRAEQLGQTRALIELLREGSPWRDRLLEDGDPTRVPLAMLDYLDKNSTIRREHEVDFSKVDVPTLMASGWHDVIVSATVDGYNQIPLPPERKKLIMGDWYHVTMGSGLGKYPNPPRLDVLARAWFDHWLKGIDNGVERYAPVTVFSQGDGWTNSDQFPRKGMAYRKLYLSGQQAMSTAYSMLDGSLAEQPDDESSGHWISFGLTSLCSRDMVTGLAGTFAYLDPCHTDSRIAELNGLTFSSEPVAEQTVVSGPLAVHLNTVQQNRDGYWNVTVNDVDETGQSVVLATGQQVVSLRGLDESRSKRLPDGTVVDARSDLDLRNWQPVEPGEPVPVDIGLGVTDATLQPGHRLRVDVFAGNFPKALAIWPFETDTRLDPQLLELDPQQPSWVTVPSNTPIPGVS